MSLKSLLVLALIATFIALAVAEVLRNEDYNSHSSKYGQKAKYGYGGKRKHMSFGQSIIEFLLEMWAILVFFFQWLMQCLFKLLGEFNKGNCCGFGTGKDSYGSHHKYSY